MPASLEGIEKRPGESRRVRKRQIPIVFIVFIRELQRKNYSPRGQDYEYPKNASERVTSTPDRSTNAIALGLSTFTVTRSLPNCVVAICAMNVARASTVWKAVSSTRWVDELARSLEEGRVGRSGRSTNLSNDPRHLLIRIHHRRPPGQLSRTPELQRNNHGLFLDPLVRVDA